MFNHHKVEIEFGEETLVLETGKIARQASGAVVATYGETQVLCASVGAKEPRPGMDFFPLTVNYIEKSYAAGKIPGGFFKREGRPSESEILVCRLMDRPIRPLFPNGYKNEVQITAQVLCHDLENPADIPALIAASASLAISPLPFMGPIGAARVGLIDGEYILNPTSAELAESELDLVVAGTREGVLMVESEAHELDEEVMLGAVMFGWESFQPVIDAIEELVEKCGKEKWEMPALPYDKQELYDMVKAQIADDLEAAYKLTVKQERRQAIDDARAKSLEALATEELGEGPVNAAFKAVESDIVRGGILKTGKRIDGRDGKTVRQIESEVALLPRAHGSALFTRGETQAIVVATLGTGQDEQIIDALEGEYRSRFMLHYNFPPYSVGECGRVGFTSRREIGHGKLGWRAINPLLPSAEDFPYTIRLVSEITESNGSSSMATVCGGSLALMDAGVPLPRPVAGIAMGLIKEGDDYAVLSDILGDEDHLGDMDFKVAGTTEGITSLQMDIKITSITKEIMEVALEQARDGRIHILGEMSKALNSSRDDLNEFAPRIETMTIKGDKIRDVIGTGGKVIREITEVTGCKIDLTEEDGKGIIKIASNDGLAIRKAKDWIEGIVAEPELNKIYNGRVVKTMDFGAFVNFLGAKDGLVHISELEDRRVNQVTDVVKEGDMVKVKVIGFDPRGKVKLSMKQVDQETGEEKVAEEA